MVKRIGGFRRKTRHKLGKSSRERGKISLTRFLQTFKEGDMVQLGAEPAYHKGMYCMRYYGKVGFIKKKVGRCYNVEINDRGLKKLLIIHPVHIRLAKQQNFTHL